jgi:outer membrane protein TolC
MGSATDREIEVSVSEKALPIESYPEIAQKLALLEQKTMSLGQTLPSFRDAKKNTTFSLFTNEEVENWIRLARQRRPEIQKTASLAKIAREEIRMQQGAYFPKISLFADYGYYKPINGLFIEQQYNFAGGLKLSWNIFDSFKRELKIKEAKYANYAAELTVDHICERSDVSIRDEISQMEEALFSYVAAHDAMLLASQGMKDAKVRLSAGTISPLQYRDATRAWAEARRGSDQARFAILEAYFRLRHDAGLDAK